MLYPRLAPELGFGYGRLLHQFYPPLGVELAAWLHALGLGYIDAARATFSLCLLSSALGMFAFARPVLRSAWLASLAAVAYVWSPYVLLDAHKGGVLGESIALAIMPWALLATHNLARTGGVGWLATTAVALALVVLGHNITALFFVGLASVYGVLVAVTSAGEAAARGDRPVGRRVEQPTRWRASRRVGRRGSQRLAPTRWRTRSPARAGQASPLRDDGVGARLAPPAVRVGLVAGAVLLALALAAIYWLPALAELPYSRVSEQRTGDFNVARNLAGPAELFQPSVLFDYFVETVPRYGLVVGLLTAGSIGIVALAAARRRRQRARLTPGQGGSSPNLLVVGAFALCFAIVLLLQLRVSAVVWQTVPLISFVQFPQRLFVFASFAGAVVLGALPWAVRSLGVSSRGAALAGLAVVAALGASSLPGSFWTWPVAASHLIAENEVAVGTAAERRLAERRAFDDYFPIWVEEDAAQISGRPARAGPRSTSRRTTAPCPAYV